MLTLIFIGLVFTISYFESKKIEAKVILSASRKEAHRTVDLRLRENNKVEFNYGHIEERCTCKGNYVLKGDTIQITDIQKRGGLQIYDKYLITDEFVVPIKNNKLEQDTAKYLERTRDSNVR